MFVSLFIGDVLSTVLFLLNCFNLILLSLSFVILFSLSLLCFVIYLFGLLSYMYLPCMLALKLKTQINTTVHRFNILQANKSECNPLG